MPLGARGLDLPTIIVSAVAAVSATTTQGYAAAAASPSISAATPAARVLFLLKMLQLRFIFEGATNTKIPRI